ncbi:hypothetical protein [Nonomuraea sp. NPDC049400]|uniref:hypothetical protein n=1 Tax=Nonomuraea sp. NPDC049400 TaxID=3364352 RepID=UPI0037AC9B88
MTSQGRHPATAPAILRLDRHDDKDTMAVTACIQAARSTGSSQYKPVPVVDSAAYC